MKFKKSVLLVTRSDSFIQEIEKGKRFLTPGQDVKSHTFVILAIGERVTKVGLQCSSGHKNG